MMRAPSSCVVALVWAVGCAAEGGAAGGNVTAFWEAWAASIDLARFDPRVHDPRTFRHEGFRLERSNRRLEENSCVNSDGVCCSLCKQGLPTCDLMAGFLVEDRYYPSEPAVTGSCDNIAHRAGLLDVFGPSRSFRDTPECRKLVQDYTCLWWASENSAYDNACVGRGKVLVRPCRSYCTQIAIQCANNLEYMELCVKIACPPFEETCTPGPFETGQSACDIYRYQTPREEGADPRAITALGALVTGGAAVVTLLL